MDFDLDPLAAHFFPDKSTLGDAAVDWKLIALEQHELAQAICKDQTLEVDGNEGLKDIATVCAMFEAACLGRTVCMDEVESGVVSGYQKEIDEAIGVVAC